MPVRPLINKGVVELEALYEQWAASPKDLRLLAQELDARTVPRAKNLHRKVVARLEQLRVDSAANPGTLPRTEQSPPPTSGSRPRYATPTHQERDARGNGDQEPSPPVSFTLVQPPPVANRPSPYKPELLTDLRLKISKEDSQVKIFRVALAALILEMKQRRLGQQSFLLERGMAVAREISGNSYEFAFTEQATLFEGAKVEIVVGGRVVSGSLTAINEAKGSVVITLQDNFGERIDSCILRIDATALLQALHDRLEKIEKGEVSTFRANFAERVLTNQHAAKSTDSRSRPPQASELNDRQRAFVEVALANDISWLWGPPGTGKTQTLAVLTRALFDAGRRVLICSNTNQAVDQLLLGLCKQAKAANHSALQEGKIIRLGRIEANGELERGFSDFVTVDGIVARKSKALAERKAAVETELTRLNQQVAFAEEILRLFLQVDKADAAAKQAEASLTSSQAETQRVRAEHERVKTVYTGFQTEAANLRSSGSFRRVFLRSEQAVQSDMDSARRSAERSQALLEQTERSVTSNRAHVLERREAVAKVNQAVSGHERSRMAKFVEEADRRRQPLRDELSRISEELDSIREAVLRDARIVGATITRTYLRPTEFAAFDAVIIDEASMILLPMVFYAAGLATERVIITGDFRQLPPILQTEQREIDRRLGRNIFEHAKIDKSVERGALPPTLVMLSEQYRMHEAFGKIVSSVFYARKLVASKQNPALRSEQLPALPPPLAQRITLIDTSRAWPFTTRDPRNSRFNLLHALAIRNLVLHLKDTGHLKTGALGVCTPYSAQAKLIKAILDTHGMKDEVRTSTAHGFQGAEREIMVWDLVDSVGERNAGIFQQAESIDDTGAKLQNVALSRAKDAVIVLANLTYLEARLPGHAVLRTLLSEMQRTGKIVDVRDILALRPVFDDLRRFDSVPGLSADALKNGLFDGRDFTTVIRRDMEQAKHSIAIFSGFITEQRVAQMGDLLRQRIHAGVKVRCVTRPPDRNGNIAPEQGRAALKSLEAIGAIVDLRADIHEKAVLIDNRITWFGSLNPLSHTSQTTELMGRVEDPGFTLQVAAQLSARRRSAEEVKQSGGTDAENPRCPCGGWSILRRSKHGRFFAAEDGCGWTQDVDRPRTNQAKAR